MTLIKKAGSIPATPHTEHYYLDKTLTLEEIHGCYGFSGPWSRKLHVRRYPTELKGQTELAPFNFSAVPIEEELPLQPFLIQTADIPTHQSCLNGRDVLVYGPQTRVSSLKAKDSYQSEEFFRNGEYHELWYVQDGKGVLQSEYGTLEFRREHYVSVPKGTTYRIEVSDGPLFVLLIESSFPIEWPPHYMNHGGQAHMISPVVETQIGLPQLQDPKDESGEYTIWVQHQGGRVSRTILGHHPFDVCGWEGALYPFTFDIRNHHAIARAIHTAPPAHQTFQAGNVPYNGFSLCSFVAQMEGWHPKEVPAPFAHSNVDSDEVMFFCNTNYGARKDVLREGSFTVHPASIPHSPHGRAAEESLTERGTMNSRLAVMLDTYFESFELSKTAYHYREPEYSSSWHRARNKQ